MGPLHYKGKPTGAIYGVLTRLLRWVQEHTFSTIAFVWDSPESKRKKRFPFYKEGRRRNLTPEMKALLDEGFAQFNLLRATILPTLGIINQFSQLGYEADDLMARYAIQGDPCTLLTSDEDLWQCVRPGVVWCSPQGVRVDMEGMKQKGIKHPSDWAMVKAIAGCPSDNVPGIPGAGPVRATQFIYNALPNTPQSKELEKTIRLNWVNIIERNLELVRLPFLGTALIHPRDLSPSAAGWEEVAEEYGLTSLQGQGEKWEELVAGGGGSRGSRGKQPTRGERSRVAGLIGARLKKLPSGGVKRFTEGKNREEAGHGEE